VTPEKIAQNQRVAGLVKRYHTWPTITTQSVGEHSWQVYRIYNQMFGVPPENVAYCIMTHDMGELVTGDPPYPTKSNNPELKKIYDHLEDLAFKNMDLVLGQMSEEDGYRFKIAHMMEMWEFGVHEMSLGNTFGKSIRDRCEIAVRKLASGIPEFDAAVTDHLFKMRNFYELAKDPRSEA